MTFKIYDKIIDVTLKNIISIACKLYNIVCSRLFSKLCAGRRGPTTAKIAITFNRIGYHRDGPILFPHSHPEDRESVTAFISFMHQQFDPCVNSA